MEPPPQTAGIASGKPGNAWMTKDLFLLYLEHFVSHVHPSPENPVLILMDNHESHTSYDAILLAKEKGIHLLTFPPHTSSRLQPLDVSVYGPLKTYWSQAMENWLRLHPGRAVTEYEIGELLGVAFPKAFSQTNITSGFSKPGIFPLNTGVWQESDFLPALRREDTTEPGNQSAAVDENLSDPQELRLSQSPSTTTHSTSFVVPEDIIPLPRREATNRKTGRKPGVSKILTSTPVKDSIQAAENERKAKKEKKDLKKSKKAAPAKKPKIQKKTTKRLLTFSDESGDEAGPGDFECDDNSDDSFCSEDFRLAEEESVTPSICSGDFVLVEYKGKKGSKFYTGEVLQAEPDGYTVNFLKRNVPAWRFTFPKERDEAFVDSSEVVMKLPVLMVSGGTKRIAKMISFDADLTNYSVE